MHYLSISTLLLVIGILLSGCDDSPVVSNPENLSMVYSTSFETPADTAGWVLNGTISNEGAPFSGKKSLLMNGEDALSGSRRILGTVGADSIYHFQFYGRVLGGGGSGKVRILQSTRPSLIPPVSVNFYDTTWGYYSARGSFPPGTELMIQCIGLGIGPAGLVDDIRVYTVPQ